MGRLADYEYVLFAIAFVVLAVAAQVGAWGAAHLRPVKEEERAHLSQITGACLSILALIIGFSFSAAISRYDERKNCEQEEANAISSEYTLVGLLPDADAAQERQFLEQYVQLRIAYYKTADHPELASIRAQRTALEAQMWPIVERDSKANQTPIMAQVLAGMNNVLSRPGYSQAAALDRIPDGAWTLMAVLAVFCCLLLGYSGHGRRPLALKLVVPLFLALSFFIIASLDAQRRGLIRVLPQNLIRVQQEMGN
jgi:hypothetical protein